MKRRKFVCPCDACQNDRAAAKLVRQKRQEARFTLNSSIVEEYRLKAARAESEMAIYKSRLQRFEGILGRIQSSREATWTGADGTQRVQALAKPHLFYALAKGYRGEYPGHYSRSIVHLENEALRRLIGGTWPEKEGPLT